MGNKLLISLLLVAPFWGYGVYQLLAIHDHDFVIEKYFTFEVSRKGRDKNSLAVGTAVILEILLILSHVAMMSIFSLSFTLLMYLWWVRGEEKRSYEKKRSAIDSELTSIAEVYSILISAGVPPTTAFEWIGQRTRGNLGEEIQLISHEIREGDLLISALENSSQRIGSHKVRRFVDTICLSLERGSSLADQLRNFVSELRMSEQRELLIKAGKSEIALMIPIVFLILPISVLFALWPSYQSLNGFLIQ
jgi:tight adherence protein C